MTSQGIIYYNRGSKCLVRLSVSITSLRDHYVGPATLMYEDPLPEWVFRLCREKNIDVKNIPPSPTPLLRKTELWRFTPYTKTVYLDTDTVICKDPSPLFEAIDPHGYFVTTYADWHTRGNRIKGRIGQWEPIVGKELVEKAVAFGPAVNTGVFGFHTIEGKPLLEFLQKTTTEAYTHPDYNNGKINAMVLDEIAGQLAVAIFPHTLVGEEWNRSVNNGVTNDPSIVHYHGGKHVMPNNKWCELWKNYYWRVRHQYKEVGRPEGDRRLHSYLTTGSRKYGYGPVCHHDLTIVTCGDKKYAPTLTRNFKEWMKIPGLREQQFLIFTLNARTKSKEYDELRKYSNVRLVKYVSPHHIREAAFSSFVYGCAEHVKTKFWMKLDADMTPIADHFEYPKKWREHTISADPWHYTRNKPAFEREKDHWLNRLDAWYGGEPLFKTKIPGNERFGHKRLRSCCWIEKTDFTKEVVKKCGPRLPIPSHDTTTWYIATRKNEPIQAYKFRKWMKS